MSPQARAKIGLDLIRAAGAAEDEAANREARERLDRRLEALPGNPEDAERQHDKSRAEDDAAEDVSRTRLSEERHAPRVAPKGPTE